MNIFGQGRNQQLPEDAPLDAVENDQTDRYWRYDKILGRGAFKIVYKAFDVKEGLEVAWNKVILGCAVNDDGNRRRLFSEIKVLKRLKHKNIMTFYDSWLDEKTQTLNFITELFTDGSLKKFRARHKHLELNVLKKWAWKILQGLVYLHGHNPPIIHRDLKCDNIFINGVSGDLKIGDLGLATLWKGMTAPQSVLGTPEFMAPEYYNEKYDEKVDVYAFGMLLLELVTMEYPYCECTNPAAIYKKVSNGVLPESLNKVKTKELNEFIILCIAHDPKERPEARKLLKHPFFDRIRREMEPKRSYSGDFERITSNISKDGNSNHVMESDRDESDISDKNSHENSDKPDLNLNHSEKNTSTISIKSETEDLKELEPFDEDQERKNQISASSRTAENFSVECRKEEGGSILMFTIKFKDFEGHKKAIQFPFDINDDTAEQVIAEMLEDNASMNLPITDDEAGIIGRLIAEEVAHYQNHVTLHVNVSRTDVEAESQFQNTASIDNENSDMLETLCTKADDVLYEVSATYQEEEEVLKALSLRSSDILDIVSGQDIYARSPMKIINEQDQNQYHDENDIKENEMEEEIKNINSLSSSSELTNIKKENEDDVKYEVDDIVKGDKRQSALGSLSDEINIMKLCKSPSIDIPNVSKRRPSVHSEPGGSSLINTIEKIDTHSLRNESYIHEASSASSYNHKLDPSTSFLAKSLGRRLSKSHSITDSPSGLIVSYRKELSPKIHKNSLDESSVNDEMSFYHSSEKISVPRAVSMVLLDNSTTATCGDLSDMNNNKKRIYYDKNILNSQNVENSTFESLPSTSVISVVTITPLKEISEEMPHQSKVKKLNIEDAKQKVDSWSQTLVNESLKIYDTKIEKNIKSDLYQQQQQQQQQQHHHCHCHCHHIKTTNGKWNEEKKQIVSPNNSSKSRESNDDLEIMTTAKCNHSYITNIMNVISNSKNRETSSKENANSTKSQLGSSTDNDDDDDEFSSPFSKTSNRNISSKKEGVNYSNSLVRSEKQYDPQPFSSIDPFDEMLQEKLLSSPNKTNDSILTTSASETFQKLLPPLPPSTSLEGKSPTKQNQEKPLLPNVTMRCDNIINLDSSHSCSMKECVQSKETLNGDNIGVGNSSNGNVISYNNSNIMSNSNDNDAKKYSRSDFAYQEGTTEIKRDEEINMDKEVLKDIRGHSGSINSGITKTSMLKNGAVMNNIKKSMGFEKNFPSLTSEANQYLNRMYNSCCNLESLGDLKMHNLNKNNHDKCNNTIINDIRREGSFSPSKNRCINSSSVPHILLADEENDIENQVIKKLDENCMNKDERFYRFDDNAFFPSHSTTTQNYLNEKINLMNDTEKGTRKETILPTNTVFVAPTPTPPLPPSLFNISNIDANNINNNNDNNNQNQSQYNHHFHHLHYQQHRTLFPQTYSNSSDEMETNITSENPKDKIKEKRRRQAAESIDKMQELQLEKLQSDFIVTAGKVGKPSLKPNKYGTINK